MADKTQRQTVRQRMYYYYYLAAIQPQQPVKLQFRGQTHVRGLQYTTVLCARDIAKLLIFTFDTVSH